MKTTMTRRKALFGWPRGERMPAVPEVFSIEDREEVRPLLVSDIKDGAAVTQG